MAKTIKNLQAGDTAYLFRPWQDVGISEITIVNIKEFEFSVCYTYESNDSKDDLTYFSFPNREYNIREEVVFEYDMDVIGVNREAVVEFIKKEILCDLIAQKRNIEKKILNSMHAIGIETGE